LTGLCGVTFWVVLVNGLLFTAARHVWRPVRGPRLPRQVLLAIACGLLVILVPLGGGWLRLRQVERRAGRAAPLRIALIQGNIEQGLRWDREFQDENWRTYEGLSRGAAVLDPALVVWPETAMPFYLRHQERYLSQMRRLVDETGVPVLTGVPDVIQDIAANRTDYYNSSFLFTPGAGLTGQYAKAHLVPFGERFPLKERIPWLRDVNFGEGEWTPGGDTLLFRLDSLRFANLICFESIFPEITRAMARRGADFFIIITNDGWFGRSGAARQHADMAVLRAVETRRAIARCANSGISMFILPGGRVVKPTALYCRTVTMDEIPLMSGMTFYVRHGDLFLLMLALPFLAAAILALVKPRA
jgi:apolipoprotein N-acyltransferase